MKVVAIIQARMGSIRFPNKVMKRINGIPMIEILFSRLSMAKEINQIVLATSIDSNNLTLINHVKNLGFGYISGSENDVLSRYIQAAETFGGDIVVRITGDCPLVDFRLVDECIRKFKNGHYDYFNNVDPLSFPDGLDIEVVTLDALKISNIESNDINDREHVTSFIRKSNNFKKGTLINCEDKSDHRWTVDEPEDFEVICNVFNHFHPNINFTWHDVLELSINQPTLFKANKFIGRNLGAQLGSGQKLWNRAKKIIPGGNMLLSKRSEMFLPGKWPAYFSKAKGCHVWDLDGIKYTDMSIMGIGTNILGYGNSEVDDAVLETVKNGNMSTLNCPEEVYLAEKLVDLHPWADMVKLARSGGEANAIAVRIARAATGKDKIAICGYHGWHDWYLSANLTTTNSLSGHLLPGLDPKGVPLSLKDTTFPFNYNNYEELENLVLKHDIGIVKMEVTRNKGPENDFLKKVRKLTEDRGIILIFDECTTGFRQTLGGIHKLYDVVPDMAMFGKALGNGYAITAVVGKKEIMDAAQSTFISSTFWTERIGPVAALKTIEIMEKTKSWEKITSTGLEIKRRWGELANKYDLKLNQWGIPALSGFTFDSINSTAYKTLITQEMLKNRFLAANSIYVCVDHSNDIIDEYFELLNPIFNKIKQCEDGEDINKLLDGSICQEGFKRLN